MRSRRRVLNKILISIGILSIVIAVGHSARTKVPQRLTQFFSQKEATPVLEQEPEEYVVRFEDSTIANTENNKAQVLGVGIMWWKRYDMSCFQKKAVNGCDRTKGGKTIELRNLMFSKEHRGLQIFGGTGTSIKVEGTTIIGYKKDGITPIYEKETFKYCDTSGEKYESLAMINLGPISYPTTLMGQALSTFRVTTAGNDAMFGVIDPTNALFTNFKPSDIERFCDPSNKNESYTLRTLDTYNAKLPSYNLGDQMGYAIAALCKILSPDEETRKAQIKQLWETEDIGVKTVSVMVEVENNLGMVDTKFHHAIEVENPVLEGVSPQGGEAYIGMFAWQTVGARFARIPNTTGASRLLTNILLPPNKVLPYDINEAKASRDLQLPDAESSSIMTVPNRTMYHQYENSKPTIVGAISGGVYYMEESVLKDDKNLAMLSWNPKTQDNDTYFCTVNGNEERCPVVRALGGCSGEGFAQTDIRLRQLTLAAVNDTQRWVTFTDADNVVRTTVRTEQMLQDAIQPPDPLIEKASVDEILLASGKGSVVCLESAQKRVEAVAVQLTEGERTQLAARLSQPSYKDQAILVSPVRVNYRSWAIYDVDQGVEADCRAYARNPSDCNKMDPDGNGWNVKKVEKWDPNKYIIRPALISFNIATYYRGLGSMSPTDERGINFKKDLTTRLAAQKIHEYTDAKVDCALNTYGFNEYWLCTESRTFLPKCQDGYTK